MRQCAAVTAGTPSVAPSRSSLPAGSRRALYDGTTHHCAAVPQRLPWADIASQTRSPSRDSSTPGPTASIVPAPSWCGTWNPSIGQVMMPARFLKSVGFTPDTVTRTRTSPGPGSGRGISTTSSTSAAGPVLR